MMREETRQKIQQYEVSPPPAAWPNIDAILNGQQPRSRRIAVVPLWARYAAAALLFIIAGLFWYLQPQPARHTVSHQPPDTFTHRYFKTPQLPDNAYSGIQPNENAGAIVTPVRQPHHSDITSRLVAYAGEFNPLNSRLTSASPATPLNTNCFYLNGNNIGNNGEYIRISRKLALAMREELNLQELPPAFTAANMQYISQRILRWKHELVHTPYLPSAENFLDIIALIESVEEK